jgi:hypothetical protein
MTRGSARLLLYFRQKQRTEMGARRPEVIAMQHMDLWFDLAVRGEPNLEEEALSRLHLSDGAEPDPSPDDRDGQEQAPSTDFF